jgi:CRISPR/Cas system CSM-associated protein Csm5 (group 7 of RAMP superfamily)
VTYLSTLQLGLEKDVKEHFLKQFESFEMLSDEEILQEQRSFLEQLNPKNRVIFRSNHASNAFHLAGTFPKDKERLLNEIEEAIKTGKNAFVPSVLRGF